MKTEEGRRRWPALLRRISRITRDPSNAEDVLQSAFVRVLEYRSNDREVADNDAFLARTAVNLAIDERRRNLRRGVGQAPDHEHVSDDLPLQDEVLAARERLARLKAGLQRLSPRTREVFLLHRLDGLKYREIADHLGITVSAVEKHVAKAALFLTGWTEKW
ncbi:RNA polymerase sigma factor [Caulobacter mirabilis]|uniref:RNA polymerase subunit sigma-24 n=1 Tax=Caulobacter mirabilis TaxID=69666 RepID=A0A2D2AZA3_9CAUL|nr:sigma-70 family RNA polymerase sigma factor [Caulobacter mirabilis]ATQ43339.1 RNA polymerase subunit sigma-24 [Caulobacter mirabilis]